MKEFSINKYLSVRLKHKETILHVAGQPFIQCKFLLLNILVTEISSFNEIESIDEATEKIDEVTEKSLKKIVIPPEGEFWGHCSNLQVWYEHGYDSRLIHSNLAFPLLKKLTEVGDPLAKKVFKKEIFRRYRDGSKKTRRYLAAEGFLQYITLDEEVSALVNTESLIYLVEVIENIWTNDNPYTIILSLIEEGNIKLENKRVIEIDFSSLDLELTEFPRAILNLHSLRVLALNNNYLTEIPNEIDKLNSLKELWLNYNKITYLPDSVCELAALEKFWLDHNKISRLPENFGNLRNLKTLRLIGNQIQKLPESLSNLEFLEDLYLSRNRLKAIPKSFCKLKSLKLLSISSNDLDSIPKCIECIFSLNYLDVSKNPLVRKPQIIKELSRLNIKKIIFK